MSTEPDDDFDDLEEGPPPVPEPPLRVPPRLGVPRAPLPPRTPRYTPPPDPAEPRARYHISELPGYNGLADDTGEPIWDGNDGAGNVSQTPRQSPAPR